MRKISYLLLVSIHLLILNSCKNTPTSSPNSTPTNTTTSNSYTHYKGTLGNVAITLDLVKSTVLDAPFNNTINFNGYYSYDNYQEPITLFGQLDSTNTIELSEWISDNNYAIFKGKVGADGSFTGIWRDSMHHKELPFALKPVTEGIVALDIFTFQDSFQLLKNNKNSPTAQIDWEAFLPKLSPQYDYLKDFIFSGIKGDSVPKTYAGLTAKGLYEAQRDTFFRDYRETFKDEKIDTAEMPHFMNYQQSSRMAVLFNDNNLLSLEYSTYEYSGGAHGNYGSILHSYDLKNKKVIQLNDIFVANFSNALNKSLDKAVRKKFNIPASQPLSSYLFDNSIQYTDNFAITPKGILFLYNPYEIASYAQGQITLFVPFDEIKGILNPNFKI